jgi:hypothetical protein
MMSRAKAKTLVPAVAAAFRRKPVADAAADELRASQGDGSHLGNWGRLPVGSEASTGSAPKAPPSAEFLQRLVDVPCPTGKHRRSMLTFRSYSVAAMFCIPCQKGWTEPTTHPALRDLATDSPR